MKIRDNEGCCAFIHEYVASLIPVIFQICMHKKVYYVYGLTGVAYEYFHAHSILQLFKTYDRGKVIQTLLERYVGRPARQLHIYVQVDRQ